MSYSLNELRLDCNNRIKLNFDGGELSSDAGLLLLKEFAHKIGFHTNYSKIPSKQMINRIVTIPMIKTFCRNCINLLQVTFKMMIRMS